MLTRLRKRIEELTSELYESQRRLTNSENEKMLLKKTLNESEQKISDLMEAAKIAEQKVRERADSYYRYLACLRPRRPVSINFPELVIDCYTSHSGPVPMTGHNLQRVRVHQRGRGRNWQACRLEQDAVKLYLEP